MVKATVAGWVSELPLAEILGSPCPGIGRRAFVGWLLGLWVSYILYGVAGVLLPGWSERVGVVAALLFFLWGVFRRGHNLGYSGWRVAVALPICLIIPPLALIGFLALLLAKGRGCDCQEKAAQEEVARAEWRRRWLESEEPLRQSHHEARKQRDAEREPRMPTWKG